MINLPPEASDLACGIALAAENTAERLAANDKFIREQYRYLRDTLCAFHDLKDIHITVCEHGDDAETIVQRRGIFGLVVRKHKGYIEVAGRNSNHSYAFKMEDGDTKLQGFVKNLMVEILTSEDYEPNRTGRAATK